MDKSLPGGGPDDDRNTPEKSGASARRTALREAALRPARATRNMDSRQLHQGVPVTLHQPDEPAVFISYARHDILHVRLMVDQFRSCSLKVIWDQDFVAGRNFAEEIKSGIGAASCVIVVWSQQAARSRFVCDEAELARAAGKLVATHLPEFDFADLPIGLGRLHSVPIDDFAGLSRAVAQFGVTLSRSGS
jgi:hypothetical protein